MSDHFLDDRRAGLENAFFAKQDALLRQRLGEAEEIKTQRETLSAASGIKDVAALDKLLAQKITAATLAAFARTPGGSGLGRWQSRCQGAQCHPG